MTKLKAFTWPDLQHAAKDLAYFQDKLQDFTSQKVTLQAKLDHVSKSRAEMVAEIDKIKARMVEIMRDLVLETPK